MALDPFSKTRIARLIEEYKATNGCDISAKALREGGVSDELVKDAIKAGYIKKHQVKVGSGALENRFKLAKDWKALNAPK